MGPAAGYLKRGYLSYLLCKRGLLSEHALEDHTQE